MTFSIPIFVSALTFIFILPIFGLIFKENEKKRMQRIRRTTLDIHTLALNGWILIVNRYLMQCSELTKDLNVYKKLCKHSKKLFLPIYDVCIPTDMQRLLVLTEHTLLH